MKKLIFPFLAVIMAVTLVSLKSANDFLKSFGLTSEWANKSIVSNLTGVDEFKLPYMEIAPEILSGDKTGAAKEVCAYLKTYCESSEFAADYEKYRQKEKPRVEEITQVDAEGIKDMKDAAKTWDELAKDKTVSKAQRDEYRAMADGMFEQIAHAEDPLLEWKQNFPENPATVVKKGLEEYLATVKTVDFNAQLNQPDEYKTRKFANPTYESKSLQWKAIFRAGKEVNTVATEFTKQWLASGIKTGQQGFGSQINLQSDEEIEKIPDSAAPSTPVNSTEKPESLKSKTKGMIKSLKDNLVKIP